MGTLSLAKTWAVRALCSVRYTCVNSDWFDEEWDKLTVLAKADWMAIALRVPDDAPTEVVWETCEKIATYWKRRS